MDRIFSRFIQRSGAIHLVFSFLRRAKVDIALEIKGTEFSPGQDVIARTTITAGEDLTVRAGVISLSCVETFWRLQNDGKNTSLHRKTQDLAEITVQFANDSTLRKAIPYREEHRLTLPDDSPLTLTGKIVNISWQARASLDVPGARDVHVVKSLAVVPTPTISDRPAPGYPTPVVLEESYDECRMRLELPSDSWRIGDSMTGRLRLDAVGECEFSQIRVELILREKAGDKKSQDAADSMVLERDFALSADRSQEWRFTLGLPAEPSRSTSISKTSLEWSVKGVFARKRRRDQSIEKVVTVG